MHITLSLTPEAAEEFRVYHNRATNTLEPNKWPEWLKALDDALDTKNRTSGHITSNSDFIAVCHHEVPRA